MPGAAHLASTASTVARRFGIEQAVDAAHPIDALLLHREVPAPGVLGVIGAARRPG